MKIVFAEIRTGKCYRIIPNAKTASKYPDGTEIRRLPKAQAIREIREQVYDRSGGHCEHCGAFITWHTMEMNERVFKGRGGEVSVENCEALCYGCHQGRPDSVHGDRRWGGRRDVSGRNATGGPEVGGASSAPRGRADVVVDGGWDFNSQDQRTGHQDG